MSLLLALQSAGPVTVSPATASLVLSGQAPAAIEAQRGSQFAGRPIFLWQRLPGGAWALHQVRRAWTLTAPAANPNVTVSPASGSLTLTGQAPTIFFPGRGQALGRPPIFTWERHPGGVWQLVQVRRAWSISSDVGPRVVEPASGTLTLEGREPLIDPIPSTAALTFSGQTPALDFGVAIPAGALVLSGAAPTPVQGKTVVPAAASLLFSGTVPAIGLGITPETAGLRLRGETPVPGFAVFAQPARAQLLLVGRTPLLLGISIWRPDSPALPIWSADAPPSSIWSADSPAPSSWSEPTPPSSIWTPDAPAASSWSDDAPPATAWAAPIDPTTAWAADSPPSTLWSADTPGIVDWTEDAPAYSAWRELRAERAWETEKLDTTKTEEWDIPTEQMGGGTPRTPWTSDGGEDDA